MQSLIPLIQFSAVFGFFCMLVILYMQVRAYRRHRQKFFLTLANSSAFALLSSALATAPYFFRVSESQAFKLFWLSCPLGALAGALATWGSVQFFIAYDQKK